MTAELEIAGQVEALLAEPVAQEGFRLLEVQYRHEDDWVLRLLIERRDGSGISLDDCGAVSELAGRLLDVDDTVPQAYRLEVSSPGVFRPLRERRHFEQSVGREIRFTLAPEVLPERKERTVRGVLNAVAEDGTVTVTPEAPPRRGGGKRAAQAAAPEPITVPLAGIRKARLDPAL